MQSVIVMAETCAEDDHLEIARFHGDESIEGGKELLLSILSSHYEDEKRYERKPKGILKTKSRPAKAKPEAK